MIDAVAFQTRARTIDHLGREQIADCPTAVSELWKNAYDAYARQVSLEIYDGVQCIATICDDGHGMNREEFSSRWLVVGTESKAGTANTPEDDRQGLAFRTKQGQKGIGRLSSANLGSLLLIVSKRKDQKFVAALVDWRLFENPYLFLMDVEIPIVEFDDKSDLIALLPELFDRLMGNLWGSKNTDSDNGRDARIADSWTRFDNQELSSGKKQTTKAAIESTLIDTLFEERHFREWPIWAGQADSGTILAISDVQFDLQAQLSNQDPKNDGAVAQAREQLFQTLSNFSDPFLSESERALGYGTSDFKTTVTVREGSLERRIVDEGHPFDLHALLDLEHVVDGIIDEGGIFRGRIKAFGTWLSGEVIISPAIDVPVRKDTVVGSFPLRIGTFEQTLSTSSLTSESFRQLEEQSSKYSGFLIYRNGLRVMPYGREGSDFFRIEYRKSKHAGRAFWSLRQLFGRVALKIENNPNLRDKAGREGLIDNRAAKSLRDLVENILKTTARDYFGTDADLRKKIIPDRKEEYKKAKANEAKNKQRVLKRREFRDRLAKHEPKLDNLVADITGLSEKVKASPLSEEEDVIALRESLQAARERYSEITLGEAPRNLGTLEERYLIFRKEYRNSKERLEIIAHSLDAALERIKPRSLREIASSELNANASFLHRRLRNWVQQSKTLLSSEIDRISEIHSDRNKVYHAKMMPLIAEVDAGRLPLRRMTELLMEERNIEDGENLELFEPYISALGSLKESVDLAGLASFSQDDADELREEVDRLHGLAQLGITVEIIGHEIEGLEQTISRGLTEFPLEVKNTSYYNSVKYAHETLVERLRFLSPLKLSGPKTRVQISGKMIFRYVKQFFENSFVANQVNFEATQNFLNFSIFDQPARIYPVFVNLVNNAAYWINHSNNTEKRILLDTADEKVVVADSGPGVDEEDLKHLFRLFFTRKIRGGRGVGLYLCRTNLAASGHSIEYAQRDERILSGANFILDFKGASYVG